MTRSAVFGGGGPARALRLCVIPGFCAMAILLLQDRMEGLDPAAVHRAVLEVTPVTWVVSLACVAAGFWAVGAQEIVMHRHFATQAPVRQARHAGMIAAAIGQTLGFGPAIGTLIRWRRVPGLGGLQAARLSVGMSIGFLVVLGFVCALATLAVPTAPGRVAAAGALAVCALLVGLCAIPPHRLARHIRLPSLICLCSFTGWAIAEMLALAAALWVFLPPDTGPGFLAVLPAVLLALGAGWMTGAPGGVGAFEVTLLALLPAVGDAALIGAILAFRLTAFVLPAGIAGIVLLCRPARAQPATCGPALPAQPPRAEAGLVRQGVLTLERRGSAPGWMLGRLPHSCVALGDPGPAAGPDARVRALAALSATARAEGRLPCLYKTGARMALAARQAGWVVRRVAAEAWLCPTQFSPAGPAHAGLRRKLRRAGQAGVSVTAVTGPCPLAEMARVAACWAKAHGGERGFSMGRWCPHYVAGQRVFLARHEGRVIAFVTLHDGPDEWTLDLLRSLPDCPDGTMYALLTAAIDAARAAGIPRLSLAAVRRAPRRRRTGHPPDGGLARFKAAFAPRWEPLYLCAPSWWALGLTGADIARAVLRPAPLASAPPPAHGAPNGIAPAAAAWHSFAEGPLAGRAAPLRQEL